MKIVQYMQQNMVERVWIEFHGRYNKCETKPWDSESNL